MCTSLIRANILGGPLYVQVSLYGHSLGSVLTYDILCHQDTLKSPFPVQSINAAIIRNNESEDDMPKIDRLPSVIEQEFISENETSVEDTLSSGSTLMNASDVKPFDSPTNETIPEVEAAAEESARETEDVVLEPDKIEGMAILDENNKSALESDLRSKEHAEVSEKGDIAQKHAEVAREEDVVAQGHTEVPKEDDVAREHTGVPKGNDVLEEHITKVSEEDDVAHEHAEVVENDDVALVHIEVTEKNDVAQERTEVSEEDDLVQERAEVLKKDDVANEHSGVPKENVIVQEHLTEVSEEDDVAQEHAEVVEKDDVAQDHTEISEEVEVTEAENTEKEDEGVEEDVKTAEREFLHDFEGANSVKDVLEVARTAESQSTEQDALQDLAVDLVDQVVVVDSTKDYDEPSEIDRLKAEVNFT